MQQPFIFINRGNGWESLYNHLDDVTALADFTIRWGISELGEQPDPAVAQLTIKDRTGKTTGDIISLAGARLLIQISTQPTLADLTAELGAFIENATRLENARTLYQPPAPATATATAATIFDGIITSGGSIEKTGDTWSVKLSASSRMILWKRIAYQGPTSSDARFQGLHWVGTPAQRLAELMKRGQNAGAPAIDTNGLSLPTAVAPYSTDTYPTALELVQRLYAADSSMPLWCETPDGVSSTLKAYPTARPASVTMHSDGTISVLDRGIARQPLAARRIPLSSKTLTVPTPVTQIVVKTKGLSMEDGGKKLSVDDAEVDFTSGTLPDNLKAVQKSMTVESDVVTNDASNGLANGRAWSPSQADRDQRARTILQMNTRLHPETLDFDSRYIDPAEWPELYTTAPTGALLIIGSIYQELTTADGYPLAVTPFMLIGGTIAFGWKGATPVLTHTATPVGLPRYPLDPYIRDLSSVTARLDNVRVPLSIVATINQFN